MGGICIQSSFGDRSGGDFSYRLSVRGGDKIHFAIYEFRFLMHDLAPYGETVMIKKDTKLKFES